MAILIGREIPTPGSVTTQVYKATHDGEGNRLPYMHRSFISFTYGGKHIEDFNLIATIDGDRLQRYGYAQFEDITTSYDALDGQFYWGTHYTMNSLDLVLATDGITQYELDNFKAWFAPGVTRDLILAEHPNRVIGARVAAPPVISVLPFEKEMTATDYGYVLSTSTTLYRGEISLSFIMDEPHWHALYDYIPIDWIDANGNVINGETTLDGRKISIEDNIPLQSNLMARCFIGGNKLVRSGEDLSEEELESAIVGSARVGFSVVGLRVSSTTGLSIGLDSESKSTSQYLFYSGNTQSKPIIKFTLNPIFSENYIVAPYNKIAQAVDGKRENYIAIGSSYFKFTTPSLFTGYNQAIQIIKSMSSTDAVQDLKDALRDGVNEYYSRAWALYSVSSTITGTTLGNTTALLNKMKEFFDYQSGAATFTFNSKTGEAVGVFHCKAYDDRNKEEKQLVVTENVGDMIRSTYPVIKDRNYLNASGQVVKENCTEITTDYPGLLNDFLILYDNMYL